MKLYQALTLIGFLALTSCQPNQQSNENNDTTHQHQASEATPDNSKKVLSPRLQTMANIGDVHELFLAIGIRVGRRDERLLR